MTPTVRPFGWWHIPAAVIIDEQLFPESPWSEAQFWGELAAEGRRLFAVEVDEGLIGYAVVALAPGEAEIHNLAVCPSYQGRGIGYALLQAMLQAADDGGARRVLLEARAGNATAISLYERNGFRVVGKRPNYYALGVDAVLMERP